MSWELTEEQRNIKRAARDFVEGEFDEDLILELEKNNQFPHEILKKACKLGFIGIHYPEDFGGQGYGLFENILVIEEFCRKDSGVGIALSSADMGADLILKFGDDGQKRAFLTPITKGMAISSLVCPKNRESNSFSIPLRKNRDQYVLNGETTYVVNGSLANFFVLYCRNDSEDKQLKESNLFVIVEKDSNGVRILDIGDKLGMRMLSWNKLILSGVEITQKEVLRAGNNHLDQLTEIQKVTRIKTGAQALGLAQGAFEQALSYSKQREQFGKKIAEFQGIRHKLSDMYIKIQAARLLIYNTAYQCHQKGIALIDATTVELYAEMAAVEVTDESLQIFGGAGYMIETPVEHFYRDARMIRAFSGRRSFQKDVIANYIIR